MPQTVTTGRAHRTAWALWVLGAVLAAALVAGCGDAQSKDRAPATKPTTQAGDPNAMNRVGDPSQPANLAPKVPDADDEDAQAGMEILVTNPRVDREADEGAYKRDATCPSGRLVGACRWAGKVINPRSVPGAKPIDCTGPYAIKDPLKGEAEYFRNIRLKERTYVGTYRGFFPTSVALMLRGIKKGRRAMVNRGNCMVREGRFRPHVQFNPIHERVMFGTYDSFATHVVMKSLDGSKTALDKNLSAFDRDTIKPLGGGGVHFTRRPTMLQSAVVHELGGYAITGKRHPWKAAYVFFVDNPYVVVSDRATFAMDHVPVGRWKMDVWHPAFKPVAATIDVEIKADQTTEVPVMFEPPDWLKPKPKSAPAKK